MSPLWSSEALAEAGWTRALERGLVEEVACPWPRRRDELDRVRRIVRPPIHSHAL